MVMMMMMMEDSSVPFQRIPTACLGVTARRTSQAKRVSSSVHYGVLLISSSSSSSSSSSASSSAFLV